MRHVGVAIAIGLVSPAAAADPTLARARAQLDAQRASCNDTCCLAMAPWFGELVRKPAELAVARAEIARPADPRQTTLALIVLAPAATLADVEAIGKLVDDGRPGGDVPTIQFTQLMQRCYPVRWIGPSVGRPCSRCSAGSTRPSSSTRLAITRGRRRSAMPRPRSITGTRS
jgi:hypothetical protein